MKKTGLKDTLDILEGKRKPLKIKEETAKQALSSLKLMLELGKT